MEVIGEEIEESRRPASSAEMTDDERWQTVLNRDGRFDGSFVYAVRTTGVYCRPSCPSRQAKRVHVSFFLTAESAEAAGYRPCLRCQPKELLTAPAALVERARRWIEEHDEGPVRLAALGQALGVSPYHLQRTFKREVGLTPRQYGESLRLARLKARLRGGEGVTSALYSSGFGSSSRLYEQARAQLGMTPGAYLRGGRGAVIRYAIADSPLGRLLVAATEHGICTVAMADSDAALVAHLEAEYPAAERHRDEAGLVPFVQPLLAYLAGDRPKLGLPLDLAGTSFQRRVWEALLAIPYGSTRTYGEVARSLGQPTAARAVAHACATNPAAIVVPCHRVLRRDGGLGGYRWGLERKRALLERENG